MSANDTKVSTIGEASPGGALERKPETPEAETRRAGREAVAVRLERGVDARLAELWIDAGNAPREGAAHLRGRLAFGECLREGGQGRVYRIRARFAFLRVRAERCSFDFDVAREELIQPGRHRESREASQTSQRRAQATGSLGWGVHGPSGEAKAGAGWRSEGGRKANSLTQPALWRTRYVAGGVEIGDPRGGDRFDLDGALKGRFLDGEWGALTPMRGERRYGARFDLLVRRGGLTVELDEPGLLDALPFKASREKSAREKAFDLLKSAVAGWACEDHLASHFGADGFDAGTGEIVVACAAVAVDLDAFEEEAARIEPPAGRKRLAPTRKGASAAAIEPSTERSAARAKGGGDERA